MRTLRKIVFINSAHIRYAEVMLDGNVHFIGTQGVGKSTLLRAILFFYNADKQRLGIPKEMKSFDEFYLPNSNSYIVYEVDHEHGPFSVLMFRYGGRAAYRFIDAPFSRDWLIGELGEVTSEAKVIRRRLNGAYMSNIIEYYEHFRDILYGNRRTAAKEMARFHLMESANYENIPRSIQNVFLNSRLDANFIKDIIIRSMSDDEPGIDLAFYRSQLHGFEQEYRDISCWYRLDAKGNAPVRLLADKVVEAYHSLLYHQKQIRTLCGELKTTVKDGEAKVVLFKAEEDRLTAEIDRQKRLLGELNAKHAEEQSALNQDLGAVKKTLDTIKKRFEYYKQQNIDTVLRRSAMEASVKVSLEALQKQLAELTAQYDDIAKKYQAIYQTINDGFTAFESEQQKRLTTAGKQRNDATQRLIAELEARRKAIDEDFETKIHDAAEALDLRRTEVADCEKAILMLKFAQPFKDEIDALQALLKEYDIAEPALKQQLLTIDAEINRLQAEHDHALDGINSRFKQLLGDKQAEITAVTDQIAHIDSLLKSVDGSLFQWLEANRPDWEQTIGKVINEDAVLYNTALSPQLAAGDSLFGVALDLSDLPLTVRSPKQLLEHRQQLEKQLAELQAEHAALLQQQQAELDQLSRTASPKMKEQRRLRAVCDTELRTIPNHRKATSLKIIDFQLKAKQQIAEQQKQLDDRLAELITLRSSAEAALASINDAKKKQHKAATADYNKALRQLTDSYAALESEVTELIAKRRTDADTEIARVKQRELAELQGKGVDTATVELCQRQIADAQAELQFIEQHRELVTLYKRDKEELFDVEDDLKAQRKAIADKIKSLDERYSVRRERHNQAIAGANADLDNVRRQHQALDDGLLAAQRFVADTNLCPPFYPDVPEHKTLRTPAQAVDELKSLIISQRDKLDQLKKNVNAFKANFSDKNTFNFRTDLTIDDDFTDFANNLDDFLINNKLEEYRRRTGERYTEILGRVSKEIGDLTRYQADIEKIIRDINADFRQRNFVGVIKLISLQAVESADRMVQLMKQIKQFNDDNAYTMGEINLFSSDDRDTVNQRAVRYLLDLMKVLQDNQQRSKLTISDVFRLQFRIVENDNDTGWVDKISHVGSEGTDTLVKAMINIMLINVFKSKESRRFGDFRIHCMMDEIGKLHPQNVKGILDFANSRNILLINSSPTTYNVSDYRYTYLLDKGADAQTVVHQLISKL